MNLSHAAFAPRLRAKRLPEKESYRTLMMCVMMQSKKVEEKRDDLSRSRDCLCPLPLPTLPGEPAQDHACSAAAPFNAAASPASHRSRLCTHSLVMLQGSTVCETPRQRPVRRFIIIGVTAWMEYVDTAGTVTASSAYAYTAGTQIDTAA